MLLGYLIYKIRNEIRFEYTDLALLLDKIVYLIYG